MTMTTNTTTACSSSSIVPSSKQNPQPRGKVKYHNPLLYPDILSTVTTPPPPPPPPPEEIILTLDFVVRSLRRRLWKAFQEDDAVMALRAYQATLTDFQKWLQEEHDFRIKSLQRKQEEEERQQRLMEAAAPKVSCS
jgi:hypothetical protein